MFTILYRCPVSGDVLAEETTDCWADVEEATEQFGDFAELIINGSA